VRQLVVRSLGHEAPTILITNDRTATAKALIERYARRMTIEQRLAEAIRSFRADAFASAVPLNVDLDVVLSVLGGAGCASLRRRLPGYDTATPGHPAAPVPLHRRTILNPATRSSSSWPVRTYSPCFAPPPPPRWSSPGGRANASASSSIETGVEFAARESALRPCADR
jgi:hypothetical protein